jgi:hypothetical protein
MSQPTRTQEGVFFSDIIISMKRQVTKAVKAAALWSGPACYRARARSVNLDTYWRPGRFVYPVWSSRGEAEPHTTTVHVTTPAFLRSMHSYLSASLSTTS